ncbi:MAG: DEAD/DEAH box helicase [Lachnospiraceae bacterium]|nr:DEAD/DEAH box helicase [Lachnospiraceae bacterium]
MNFNELQLASPILQALTEKGYKTPSKIQEEAIPHVLAGTDVFGCAQTGTGKTAAFALPIIQRLMQGAGASYQKKLIRALILTPTRELALQIKENLDDYSAHTTVTNAVIFGGVSAVPQIEALRRGVDILVATPGRLNDLIGQKEINLSHVEIFVLDEADRMLDMGFIHDVKKVIALLPTKRQTLLFSATMPSEIMALTSRLLHNPVTVEVTPVSSTVDKIDASLYYVDKANKRSLLAHVLKHEDITSTLVFTRTKHGADRVAKFLIKENITAAAIHGDKSQNARQNALEQFKSGQIRVLVATDIAARGIDIDRLSCVINFDVPNTPETYVHRIGRTGRTGRDGRAISFSDFEEKEYIKDIEKLIKQHIPVVEDHPFPMQIFEVLPKATQARPPRAERAARAQKPAGNPQQPAAKAQNAASRSNASGKRGGRGARNTASSSR